MTSICPECGTALPNSAPLGMCPRCLLHSARGHSLAGDRRPATISKPPSCEELCEIFAGKFAIEELLGRGGMGAVYRARQLRIDRMVAIKLLPFHDDDPTSLERFLREAKALGKLNHANIVTLIDYGEIGGYFYIVMEFVEGGDLGQRLSAGPIPEPEVARITGQICKALDYAHSRGVVHRDIKPGNILLGDEVVKLVDFGLAKGMAASDTELNLTWANEMMGTPNYIAPEQRANPLAADHRADIFALGVLTYEMLTGSLPSGNYPLPSKVAKVSRAWDRIVLKAMSTEPDQRFPSTAAMEKSVRDLEKKRFPLLPLAAGTIIIVLIFILIESFSKAPEKSPLTDSTSSRVGGRVIAFGPNLFGQATKLNSLDRNDIVAVAANDEFLPDHCFALALTASGEVVGIGDTPPPPPDLKNVSAIAIGLAHVLALTEDGEVVTWGYDQFPPPPNLPVIQQIAAAGKLSAALSTDGKVFVWGVTPMGKSVEFEPVVNKDIAEITAAPGVIIARNSEGKVILRGDPEDPTLIYRAPSQAVAKISAGQEFGMALLQDGKLWGWGWDSIGGMPENGEFDRIVSGPESCAARRRDGSWLAWGKIGTHLPKVAENALDIDFGHHVGLAVVRSTDYSPPIVPESLKKFSIFGLHQNEVKHLAFASAQNRLFAATDHAIHSYEIGENTQLIKTYWAPPNILITALRWEPNTGQLMAGFSNGKVRLFESTTFPVVTRELASKNAAAISALAEKDGTILAGDFQGTLTGWTDPVSEFALHSQAITDIAITGERVLTFGWDQLLKASHWRNGTIQGGNPVLESPAFGHDLALSPDEKFLLSSDWRGTIYRMDSTTMDLVRSWRAHLADWNVSSKWLGTEANSRVSIDFSPNGRFFGTIGSDRVVRIWDARKDELIARSPAQLPSPTHVLKFLDDRRLVTSGETGNALVIWEIAEVPQ